MAFIAVRHNIEVAHRLFDMKGKCEAIHGHSMWVELKLHGLVDSNGILDGLEFGAVKKMFRGFLDSEYDHRLLLNTKDPWARLLASYEDITRAVETKGSHEFQHLPGLVQVPGDPTTENIAKWIAEWAHDTFHRAVDVTVHETAVNAAGYSVR